MQKFGRNGRDLDKIEISGLINGRRAKAIERAKHCAVPLFILLKLLDAIAKIGRKVLIQKITENVRGERALEKYRLLIEVKGVQLVVAKTLVRRKRFVGGCKIQR